MAFETSRPNDDQLKGHADAGPSAAERWLVCPASVTLTRGVERKSTPYAREGTAAHMAAELLLNGKPAPEFIRVEGEDILISNDMLDHIEVYTRLVDMVRETADFTRIEGRVNLDWWFAPEVLPEPVHGTADFIGYDSQQRLLTVVDFKYGAGHGVSAVNNPQLMIYALGALGLFTTEFPVKIQMVIVQPRVAEPVKAHTILLNELMKWAETTLKPAIVRIGAGDVSESAGDHCKWCVRAGTCAALSQTAIDAAKLSFTNSKDSSTGLSLITADRQSPSVLSNAELSVILEKAELISGWVTKVRLEVEERIKNGAAVPGWKLVQKRGNRKWANPDAASSALEEYLDEMEIFTEPELKSPAQIEKLLKKNKVDQSVIAPLVVKESSGLTLVREADAREKVDASPAAVFKPVLVGFDG